MTLERLASDGRIGWREFTAQGDGTTLSASTVPAVSVSKRLTAYPNDLLQSPLDMKSATVTARPGGPRLAGVAAPAARRSPMTRGVDGATAAFTKFVGRRRLSPLVGLGALLLAILLGAVHALAPGHGKTVMAAFIVGERGSLRQAWLIGLTVTVTHTAGVLVLGIVLTATDLAAPDRVYGVLGLASGLLLGSVGIVLLARALRQRAARRASARDEPAVDSVPRALVPAGAHVHEHAPEHSHPHPHPRRHPHAHADEVDEPASHRHGVFSHRHVVPRADKPLGWRSIVAMGFAGGLVPSPSALVVLLGAVALGRTWFGVVLVVAYGAGMALTLTGTGLLLSRASGRLAAGTGSFGPRVQRAMGVAKLLPFVTAGVVLTVGATIALQGLRAAL
jgi:ABC-type nickel/cobalt efflux system permease component RcnA